MRGAATCPPECAGPEGVDVGLEFATDNYVAQILPSRQDSGVDVSAD